MSKCILNVTSVEYDEILQLNHDALEWNNRDRKLVHELANLLGDRVVHDICQFEECRMCMRDSLANVPRVEPMPSPESPWRKTNAHH